DNLLTGTTDGRGISAAESVGDVLLQLPITRPATTPKLAAATTDDDHHFRLIRVLRFYSVVADGEDSFLSRSLWRAVSVTTMRIRHVAGRFLRGALENALPLRFHVDDRPAFFSRLIQCLVELADGRLAVVRPLAVGIGVMHDAGETRTAS